ncbi:hypothetical protein Rsub_13262 [Raphidocelis subcapitata]|uniref:F-box domain-containing protein n=1 Tax=Raphidocelis subcapitata TaxID=307507 RepID=A0A2V0PLS2_9CHLO|nr:hypothetical protein Rsub_13262 [Raphidocelis subcapitata]|eukprot:GBG00500.1 hypothetical protein Rsub_13262 [Raphidocelis subcapitata]
MDSAADPRADGGGGGAAAGLDGEAPAAPPPLLALPQLALDSIAAALYPNAAALVRLSASCRALRALDSSQLWEAFSVQRFSSASLPPSPPGARPVRAIEGFLFFQGVAPPGGNPQAGPPSSPAALAEAAREKDAEAFATDGRLFPQLPPHAEWRNARWSLDPRQGLYVSRSAARRLGLKDPPAPPAPATWPPPADPREWLYYGGADVRIVPARPRPADAITEELPNCATVEQLLARAGAASRGIQYVERGRPAVVMQLPAVAAVTDGRLLYGGTLPNGQVVSALPPHANWRRSPDWGVGVYVRAGAAEMLGLEPPLDRDSPRALASALKRNYVRLSALALEAHELEAVWLDGQHLILGQAHGGARPCPVGVSRLPGPRSDSVLRTAAVCWLDVRGSIRGVLAGEYEVAWCVDVTEAHVTAHVDSLRLAAAVKGPSSQQPALASDDGADTPSRCEATFDAQQLVQMRLESHRDRVDWSWLRGGRLRVRPCDAPAVVEVAFMSHTSHWKQGINFAFVQLLPVASGVADLALARRPGVWDGEGGVGGGGEGGGGAGGSGGGGGEGAGLSFSGVIADALMAAAGCRQQ